MGKLAKRARRLAAAADKQIKSGRYETAVTGSLESCKWFNAPVRREKKFLKIAALADKHPDVRLIGSQRIFFNDRTSLGTDMTGRVVSTGGMSSRFKFSHKLI